MFQSDEDCNLIPQFLMNNDVGYVVSFAPPGESQFSAGNWHLYTDDWTLVELTQDGSASEFVIEQYGFLLHRDTGSTQHARIDRRTVMSGDGKIREDIKLTWMTDGNIMGIFNIGQMQMRDDNLGFAQVGSNPVHPFLSGGSDVSYPGGESYNWTSDHDWVAKITTSAVHTVIREYLLKVYPRAELRPVTRNTGDIDEHFWCWEFCEMPGFNGI